MPLIVDSDLAYMRAMVLEMLPDKCNILSETITPDGQGGVSSTWGTASTNIACRLDDKALGTNQLVAIAIGLKAAHQYQLSLPYDATISAGNRVEISGATYTVINVNANQSWLAVTRAALELI
jgi:hypothetical protein